MDREQVRAAFANPKEFTTSPLYRCLSPTVAATGPLLDLACQGRPGQYPTFLFFGAVHLLLLAGTDHPLARFYPSIAGERALPPEHAGPALVSFGREHAAELAETIRTRLVQTNQVQRAIGLRLGLPQDRISRPGLRFWVDAVPGRHLDSAVALGAAEDDLPQRGVAGRAQLVQLVQRVGCDLFGTLPARMRCTVSGTGRPGAGAPLPDRVDR